MYCCDQSWISASLLQYSVSYDPSEIILICWFSVQEIFLIIISVENSCVASYFCGNLDRYILFFRILFKQTAFIWNINICNIINVFTVTFDQFNATLRHKILLTPNVWMVMYVWRNWNHVSWEQSCQTNLFLNLFMYNPVSSYTQHTHTHTQMVICLQDTEHVLCQRDVYSIS